MASYENADFPMELGVGATGDEADLARLSLARDTKDGFIWIGTGVRESPSLSAYCMLPGSGSIVTRRPGLDPRSIATGGPLRSAGRESDVVTRF